MDKRDHNEELERDDKRYIWHPFTQMQEYLQEKPIIVERGEGSYLIDIYGHRYLDGVSSLWVTVHGHRRAEIDQAIADQLGRIGHSTLLGLCNVPAVKLAKRLVEITPAGLDKVFYSDSGSTAVEIALKIAFQYGQQRTPCQERKTKFISFTNAYHGDTVGSVSVGGIDLFHRVYRPLLFDSFKAEYPYCYRCSFGLSHPSCGMACLDQLEDVLKAHHEESAALIIEPMMQGASGMISSPPGYLRQVRDLCTKYGVLMIADEVATGFGRTGRMFACEHEDVKPDLMAVAKGITGGYLPLAATLATEEIYQGFCGEYREQKTFFHGHTYTGNPLACAAALANLDIFEKEKTVERLQRKIQLLQNRLESFKELPHVGDIRQYGFMVGIELVKDKGTKQEYPYEAKTGVKVIQAARPKGLIIRPLGDVIVLMPPLGVSEQELETILDIVYESIVEVTGCN